jgi:hypothetical protein
VDLLVALSWNMAEGIEENHEKVSQNSTEIRKKASPEHKSGPLPIQKPVRFICFSGFSNTFDRENKKVNKIGLPSCRM